MRGRAAPPHQEIYQVPPPPPPPSGIYITLSLNSFSKWQKVWMILLALVFAFSLRSSTSVCAYTCAYIASEKKQSKQTKAWFKHRILHAPNQILILVDSN